MGNMAIEIGIISCLSFFCALVTSILGFGAGLMLTPLLVFFMPLKQAIGIGALIFLVTSASKTWWFRKELHLGIWKKCLLLSLLGMIAGMGLIQQAPERLLNVVFAGLLLFFAVQTLADRPPGASRFPHQMYPLLAGIASVLAHAGGGFYFRYCRVNGLDRVATVATIAVLHFTLNIFKVSFFLTTGIITMEYLLYLTPAYLLSFLGTRVGKSILKNHVNEQVFSYSVATLLIILAVRMAWSISS